MLRLRFGIKKYETWNRDEIIDVRNTDVVYITTSTGKTIYLDDSTDELIVDAWDMEGQPIEPMIMFTPDFERVLCLKHYKFTFTQLLGHKNIKKTEVTTRTYLHPDNTWSKGNALTKHMAAAMRAG